MSCADHLNHCVSKVVISARKGPYQGQAYFHQIQKCMQNYFKYYDYTEPTFVTCYDFMALDYHNGDLPGEYGTVEHQMFIFAKCRHSLCISQSLHSHVANLVRSRLSYTSSSTLHPTTITCLPSLSTRSWIDT